MQELLALIDAIQKIGFVGLLILLYPVALALDLWDGGEHPARTIWPTH